MNCAESAEYVSALYDGERVPREIAEHIARCEACRESLQVYARIGAELRLLASTAAEQPALPANLRERLRGSERPGWLSFLTRRVVIPRLAVLSMALAFFAVTAGFVVLRAQNQPRPKWFAFDMHPKERDWNNRRFVPSYVAQAGFDGTYSSYWFNSAHQPDGAAMHVAVSSVQDGRVELAVRARHSDTGAGKLAEMRTALADLGGHHYVYTPGTTLEIPIEGGGILVLQGEVSDTQPKLLDGMSVEPKPGELTFTRPVLIRDQAVIAEVTGGGVNTDLEHAASFQVPAVGRFLFALRPFPGAIRAQANWGQLRFAWQGHEYAVLAGSPMTSGDQPHTVWAALEPDERLTGKGLIYGSEPLSSLTK